MWSVPITVIVVGAIVNRWTCDDGFIYLRTVDQFAHGNGLVFNAGERVETFTSVTWMAVLIVGDLLSPLRLEYTTAVLSIACTVLGVCLAVVASSRLSRLDQADVLRVPIGLSVLAVLWPVWVWTTGGLEIGLTYAWTGACFLLMMRWASRGPAMPPTTTLVVIGLGWLIRPEMLLSSVLFVGVLVMLSPGRPRDRVVAVTKAFALPIGYQVFRMGYYGMLVSSPALAKEGTDPRPARGWHYFTEFAGEYLLAVPLLTLLLAVGGPLVRSLLRRPDRRALVVAALVSTSGAVQMLTIVVIGGDYMHARLLLPGLFAVLAPVFVVAASRRYVEALAVSGLWAVICLLWMRPTVVDASFHASVFTYEDWGFERRGTDQPWIDRQGVYVHQGLRNDGTFTGLTAADDAELVVVAYAIGAVGYALGPDVRIADVYGLAEPITGHQRIVLETVPGHEKVASGPWFAALFAAAPERVAPLQLTIDWWDSDPPPLDYALDVAWAQAALECGPIERILSSTRGDLDVGTFFSNIAHAFGNTTLRVDRSPRATYREHCGDDLPAEVTAFYERATVGAALPAAPTVADIAVIGHCDVVLTATGQDADPWQPVEALDLNATVTLDPDGTDRRSTPLIRVGPYGTASALISLQTDGRGMYRVVQDLPTYPLVAQPWTAIPADGVIPISLQADLENRQWAVRVPFWLNGLPMLATDERSRLTSTAPHIDRSVGADDHAVIDVEESVSSEVCSAIVDHHR